MFTDKEKVLVIEALKFIADEYDHVANDCVTRLGDSFRTRAREFRAVVSSMDKAEVGQSIIPLLQRDQFINAIKEYRRVTGLGLKESKEAVEQIAKANEIGLSYFKRRGYPTTDMLGE